MSPRRKRRIIFVGGIHGVGKTTFCRGLCGAVGAVYLSASSLIGNRENAGSLGAERKGKIVRNIDENQSILLDRLDRVVAGKKLHVLDGHFCLQAESGTEKIDFSVFRAIAPIYLVVAVDEPAKIYERGKDKSGYENSDAVANFQEIELAHARFVSHRLGIPLLTIKVENLAAQRA